ncbi:MAG TPA: ABC transporter ATP-binding protein [Burkholderiaceae bacterium]|jgi:lipopolysaccharide transport system ATP-binding protein
MGSIQVNNLGKAYKRYSGQWARLAEWLSPFNRKRHTLKWVLQDISFEVKPGEAIGIIGVNGAGKSTLLKLITGTAHPTTGNVATTGRVAALLELGMGFHPDFTGRQNVLMSGQLMGMSVPEISALMPEIEAFAEIGEYIDEPVRVYSSGMQVRLAFSIATAVRPGILIVDEALAVGDVFFQQKCFERIRAFCDAGTTLLFVSHAMGTVYSLCDRAILLNEGRIALDGSPREVIDLYNAHVLQRQEGGDAKVQITEVAAPVAEDANLPAEAGGEPATGVAIGSAVGSISSEGAAIDAVDLLVDKRAVAALISEAQVTVRIVARFHRDYADPHIGFQIRNARGEAAFMTNTYCMRRTIGKVQAGETVTAEFSFKIGLCEGEYTITAGVAEGGAGEGEFNQTLARVQDAKAFTILKNLDAILWSGFYNLDPSCTLRRQKEDAS